MRRISYHPMAEVAKTLGKHKHLRNDSKSLEKHEVSHVRNPYENCGFCTSVKMWKSQKVLDGAKRLQDKGWSHVGRFVNVHFLRIIDFP